MPPAFLRSRKLLTLFVVGILIAIGLILRATIFAPDPVEVRLVAVEPGVVESTVTNSKAGTVEARRRSRIASEVGGRVVEIAHREGARVAAGEALVRLSDVSHKAQLELARQGVAVAGSQRTDACLRRDHAHRELTRVRRLAERDFASIEQLDELEYAYDSARVACEAAAAELGIDDSTLWRKRKRMRLSVRKVNGNGSSTRLAGARVNSPAPNAPAPSYRR